jgi:phosphohistidine phosphatase
MRLYLLRHGHSPSVTEAGVAKDFDRPLSADGTACVRRVIAHLQEQGGKPSLILHSPLKRAAQTAQAAREVLRPAPAIESFEPLSNVLTPEALYDALRPRLESNGDVLAVGHQPQIGELAMMLSGQVFEFRPAGLVALELGSPRAAVLWTISPQDIPAR